MKNVIIWFFILILALGLVSYPVFHQTKKYFEKELSEIIGKELSELTGSRVDCEGVDIDLLNFCFRTEKVFFRDDDKNVSLQAAAVYPTWPDWSKKQFFMKSLEIIEPQMILVREKGELKWFPDLFKKSSDNDRKWEIVFDLVHLLNPELRFIDMDVVPEQMFILTAKNFYISENKKEGIIEIKGSLSEKAMNGANLYMNLSIDRLENGFSLTLSGTGLDFARLSPYQHKWNKMKIDKGIGSFFLELESRIGNISGRLNMQVVGLNFSLLKEDIVSSALGMTKGSFLSMLKENQGRLDLNFDISGPEDNPVIRLDKRSGSLFYKLPVKLVSGTAKVLAKTVNILMLGIPGKIVKKVRENKEDQKKQQALKVK